MACDNLVAIAKVLGTIGCSWFDIVSDILNGLNFIRGSVKSITTTTCTPPNVSSTENLTTDSITDASQNCTVVTEIRQQYLIWGYLSLCMICVPGIFWAFSPDMIRQIIGNIKKRRWCDVSVYVSWCLLVFLYPLFLLFVQLVALFNPTDTEHKKDLIQFIALEAFWESFPQLVLQLFTVAYDYEVTPIQMVTIVASAFLLAKTAIEFDIEQHNIELPGFIKTVLSSI